MTAPPQLSRLPPVEPRLAAALVITLAVAVYANSLGNAFVWDDSYNVVNNPAIRSFSGVVSLFGGSLAEQSDTSLTQAMNTHYWRPLTGATYAVEYAVAGLNPVLFHGVNVAIHAIVSLVVLLLGAALFRRDSSDGVPLGSLVGAVIFAVHPVHSEAVDVITYRADMLAGLSLLGGLLVWIRGSRRGGPVESRAVMVWAPLIYAVGLACKEMAVTLPLLVALWDQLAPAERRRPLGRRLARLLPLSVVLAGYFLIRFNLLQPSSLTYFADEPASVVILTMVGVFGLYCRLMLWPWPLNPFYDWTVLPYQSSLWSVTVLWGVLCLLGFGLGLVLLWRRHRGAALALALFVVPLIPVSQLVPIIVAAGERFIYAASAGPCLLAGAALWALVRHRPRLLPLVGVALVTQLVVFSSLTVMRNTDWRSDRAVLEANVADFPRTINGWLSLARLNEREGKLQRALDIYQRIGMDRAVRRVRARIQKQRSIEQP